MSGSDRMKSADYNITRHPEGWGVEHDGKLAGTYDTKEAAFESTLGPASPPTMRSYSGSR